MKNWSSMTREQKRRNLQRWLGRAHRRIIEGQIRRDADLYDSGVKSWNAAVQYAITNQMEVDHQAVFGRGGQNDTRI